MITSTGNGRVKQLIQWQKKRKARDKEYDKVFASKVNINGKRMKTASYTRMYID